MEALHKHHYIHRDIKPNNFLILNPEKGSTIFMIDFGLTTRYKTETGEHIKCNSKDKPINLAGSIHYMSIDTQEGLRPSRKDDLISFCYSIIRLIGGKLPWECIRLDNEEKLYEAILNSKKQNNSEELFEDLPHVFEEIFNYCIGLKYDEEPNYNKLNDLINGSLTNSDGSYVWSNGTHVRRYFTEIDEIVKNEIENPKSSSTESDEENNEEKNEGDNQ